MKKHTLYIHGLESHPKKEKLEVIEQFSKVEALHINYFENPNTFKVLSDLIVEKKITHIIGSSFGDFLGFWLAEKHGLPCLLFNPAIAAKSLEMEHEKHSNNCPLRLVVIGDKDDVVEPILTVNLLEKHPSENCLERIISCNDLGHRIDMKTFTEFIRYFFNV